VPGFWFALSPSRYGWLAVCVAVAGLSDLVDGTVARRLRGGPSMVGAALDPVCDGVFFGAVAVGLAAGGAYPAWVCLVVIARYLVPVLVGGVLWRMGRLQRLEHTVLGQFSTVVMAVFLGGVALWRAVGLAYDGWAFFGTVVVPAVTVLAWVDLARAGVRFSRPR
jgi:cardiolipin synthase